MWPIINNNRKKMQHRALSCRKLIDFIILLVSLLFILHNTLNTEVLVDIASSSSNKDSDDLEMKAVFNESNQVKKNEMINFAVGGTFHF